MQNKHSHFVMDMKESSLSITYNAEMHLRIGQSDWLENRKNGFTFEENEASFY